jgi:hypothetical protein
MRVFIAFLLLPAAGWSQSAPEAPRVVRYEVKPSELTYTFAAFYQPVARLKSGDILETNPVDCFGNAVKKPGGSIQR